MPFLLGRKNIFLYDHWPFFSLLWIAFPQPLPIFSPFILLSFCLFLVICIILDHNPETCHMLHLVIYVARIFSPMIIYISVQGVLWWGVGSWSNNLNSSFSKENWVIFSTSTYIPSLHTPRALPTQLRVQGAFQHPLPFSTYYPV